MPIDRTAYDPEVMKELRKGKKTVAISGFATTTRGLMPWDDKGCEVWGLNESYIAEGFWMEKGKWKRKPDRWFQLHSRANFARQENVHDPNHFDWLKKQKDFPIMMQKVWPDIPMSTRYPLERYIDTFGRYGTSSMAWMVGLAALEGYERIELYGFEMSSDTEYAYQRACGEYIIGVASGMGATIYVPPQSALLKGTLYGYQDGSIGIRQQFEIRKNQIKFALDQNTVKFRNLEGAIGMLNGIIEKHPEFKDTLAPYVPQYADVMNKSAAEINAAAGALEEISRTIQLYDNFPSEQEMGDGVLEEVEDAQKENPAT